MTVKQDMEKRIAVYQEREDNGDFGSRIMRFGLIGAMARMTQEELDRELDIEIEEDE